MGVNPYSLQSRFVKNWIHITYSQSKNYNESVLGSFSCSYLNNMFFYSIHLYQPLSRWSMPLDTTICIRQMNILRTVINRDINFLWDNLCLWHIGRNSVLRATIVNVNPRMGDPRISTFVQQPVRFPLHINLWDWRQWQWSIRQWLRLNSAKISAIRHMLSKVTSDWTLYTLTWQQTNQS